MRHPAAGTFLVGGAIAGPLDFRLSGFAGIIVAGVATTFTLGGARTLFLIFSISEVFSPSELLGETGLLTSDPALTGFSKLRTDLDFAHLISLFKILEQYNQKHKLNKKSL